MSKITLWSGREITGWKADVIFLGAMVGLIIAGIAIGASI